MFLFMNLFVAFLIGFLAAEIFALIRWRGIWRLTALLPLLVAGLILVPLAIDPQSHYLLPIETLVLSFGGLCFLGILAGIRWFMRFMQQRRRGR